MNAVRAAARRALDLLLIAATIPLWATVFGVCWFAVLATTGSPVFFRQDRVGRNGRIFEVWKFRSMVVGDNPLVPEPARITPIGSILRRTSLDELPQLINVVRGDMSLVGPRPMLPSQVELLSPEQRERHLVRPGLTGRAQVSGRNAIAWHERIEHDRAWANEPTLRAYLSILVRTIAVTIRGDGVDGHDASDPIVDLVPELDLDVVELLELTEDDRLRRKRAA